MGIKITVKELCEACGGRNARRVGDDILINHQCPAAPPGPSDPPQAWPVGNVRFIEHDFAPSFLRAELDEAWLLISDLRILRWKAERAVIQAVTDAMTKTYATDQED